MAREYGDAVMIVLPSDHLIKYNKIFINTMNDACEIAAEGENLITIGITPTYPETGYGYIKFNTDEIKGRAYKVDKFVEKPDLETAKSYLESEQYFWNSGMFVWKVSTLLKHLKNCLPDIAAGLERIGAVIGTAEENDVLEREFRRFKSESVDYGVMEKSGNIYTLTGAFGWDDVDHGLPLAD